jgi:hypothetical protein
MSNTAPKCSPLSQHRSDSMTTSVGFFLLDSRRIRSIERNAAEVTLKKRKSELKGSVISGSQKTRCLLTSNLPVIFQSPSRRSSPRHRALQAPRSIAITISSSITCRQLMEPQRLFRNFAHGEDSNRSEDGYPATHPATVFFPKWAELHRAAQRNIQYVRFSYGKHI